MSETFFDRDPYLEVSTLVANDGKIRKLNLDLQKDTIVPRQFDRLRAEIRARITEIETAVRQKKFTS